MKTSPDGRRFIEAFEKCELKEYWDEPGRVMTIGYGHTDAAGPPHVYPGMTITKEVADEILSSDLRSVELEVAHLVTVPLAQHQFDALVSFQFNVGALGHPHNSLLTALNSGDYHRAGTYFALYNHAGGHVLRGLVRRRQGETEMFDGLVKMALITAGVSGA